MAFQKKYYYTFKSINDTQYLVELWQNTGTTISSSEVRVDDTGFVVTYPTTNNKFDTILGSGCDISLLSVNNMMFFNLWTADMMEYQIKFYQGTGGTANLLWIGYLDSELYSEPFHEFNNYKVSFTGNDGLALLERLDYFQADGSKYTGFSDNWSIIKNVLLKLGLSWNKVYVSLSTTSTELTIGSSDTILSKTYSYQDNYYNEDNNDDENLGAMTCKEVIETILKPFGASIIQVNGSIYITDVNTIAAGGNTTFRRYNGTTLEYETNETINLSLGDVSSIKFASDSQTLNVISPINRQKITFSPFVNKHEKLFINYDPLNDTFSGSTATYNYGTYPNTWTETAYETSLFWNKAYSGSIEQDYPRYSVLTGTNANDGEEDKFLTIKNVLPPYGYSFSYTGTLPELIINTNKLYYLKIDAKCYVRTKDDMGGDESNVNAYQVKLYSTFNIGNKYYVWTPNNTGMYGTWSTSGNFTFNFTDIIQSESYELTRISDRWIDLNSGELNVEWNGIDTLTQYVRPPEPSFYIPLNTSTVGTNFNFSFFTYDVYDNSTPSKNINEKIKDVRIKDFKISLVDEKFNEISNEDIKHEYWINKNVKDSGPDVELKLGTNIDMNPLSIGGILGYNTGNYFYIQEFTRGGTTDVLEHLLARSIISNYTPKTIEIQLSINRINSILGSLTYNNYLSGNFGIQGAVISYDDEKIDVTLQQIQVDDPNLILNEIN